MEKFVEGNSNLKSVEDSWQPNDFTDMTSENPKPWPNCARAALRYPTKSRVWWGHGDEEAPNLSDTTQ